MICELDGSRMTTRESLHDHLAAQLALPEWYGRNLDALYDALSEKRDLTIVLRNVTCMLDQLGEYAWMTIRTLVDAVSAGESMEIRICK